VHPTVLTIAGSDSSGGAGIQADLKAIAACGGYGATVITAVTAQNTTGVTRAEELSPEMVGAQIDAVFSDLEIVAVKSGMLASEPIVRTVADRLRTHRPPRYVCDPVMISKSGHPLLPESCAAVLIRELLPLASLVTPNVHEAEALSGMPVRDLKDAERAGRRLLELGSAAVLVKGGHLPGAPGTDLLVTREGSRKFEGAWIESRHTHGTGCTYSAAIATLLGRGRGLEDAIGQAKEFVTEAIRGGLDVGHGVGPTDPFFFLRKGWVGAWIERVGE
jgi:hydroxymethylpyrimidine/phosphomethylpyrimidine kinase